MNQSPNPIPGKSLVIMTLTVQTGLVWPHKRPAPIADEQTCHMTITLFSCMCISRPQTHQYSKRQLFDVDGWSQKWHEGEKRGEILNFSNRIFICFQSNLKIVCRSSCCWHLLFWISDYYLLLLSSLLLLCQQIISSFNFKVTHYFMVFKIFFGASKYIFYIYIKSHEFNSNNNNNSWKSKLELWP